MSAAYVSLMCAVLVALLLILDHITHKRIDLLREQLDEIEARNWNGLWGQASTVSGYYLPDQPDTEFVSVCNGDLRKLDVAAHNAPRRSSGNDALGYATRLAEAIHDKHYRDDAPEWRPLPDLLGVLTQIDNMTAGLSRNSEIPSGIGCTAPQRVPNVGKDIASDG